jgi:outer membrane autotransporter protein
VDRHQPGQDRGGDECRHGGPVWDRFAVSAGQVQGAVMQGNGIDDFRMTGGTIQSLQQGDGRDTFLMTGGTITGAFEDGDVAQMTAGTIGRVDMKLDNNIFLMSGGSIIGNLVTGFGQDRIEISGGSIGGNVSVSGGDDSVSVTGGLVGGEVRMSAGNDTFAWSGGQVMGLIDMNLGNDTALLRNLAPAQLAQTAGFDGGLGTDTLTLDNSQTGGLARFTNWENINLQRNSRYDLDGDLVLGDAGTQTGILAIDSTSGLRAVSGVAASVRPVATGQLATVRNAGTIDLGGGNAQNRMTIVGNYAGDSGRLFVDSVLGEDNAPADRLIVAGGRLSGTTGLRVTNLGGAGGLTTRDGIMVVQAVDGAASDNAAFALASNVEAGAYRYALYKGGVTAGSADNWYLRSSVPAVPAPPAPGQPALPTPVAAPVLTVPGAAPAPPPPAPAEEAVPLYRQEVPVYTALSATSRQLAVFTLGTFHDRMGEQSILTGEGRLPGSWARVFGEHTNNQSRGGAESEFDGSIAGLQVGQDLYAWHHADGGQDRTGLFAGYANANGDIRGLTDGYSDTRSGSMDVDGYSVGAYWTHLGERGWYTDAVVMFTGLDADLRSRRGMKSHTDGRAWTGSLEAGYPLALSDSWTLEPQAQFIAQHTSFDGFDDDVSSVSFDSSTTYTGRIGARLKDTIQMGQARFEPYLRANLWREFSGTDKTVFGEGDSVPARYGSTAMQWGAGIVAAVNTSLSFYASADYVHDVSGAQQRSVQGRIGARLTW